MLKRAAQTVVSNAGNIGAGLAVAGGIVLVPVAAHTIYKEAENIATDSGRPGTNITAGDVGKALTSLVSKNPGAVGPF